MTIIVFLIDTSASMNQRAYLGGRPRLLDVAKNAVETFVKVRQRSQESRGDRYMLLTFEDPPANVKAAWKENLATFINELKNLQCLGLTTMGAALKHAFDVLNINRMQTGIDTYGQGRCPFYLEPSVIVVITDGGKLSTTGGVQEDFNLPMNCPIPGSELTREPFRWDQRLFSLVLRLSGTPAVERDSGLVPSDSSPIDAMCEVTGGRSYCITSHRMLMQCIDSLVQKVQSGVVIHLEKVGPEPPPLDAQRDPADADEPHDDTAHDDKTTLQRWNSGNGGQFGVNAGASSSGGGGGGGGGAAATGSGAGAPAGNGAAAGAPQAWHSCRRLIYVPRTVAQKGFAVGFWPIPESFRPDPNAPTLPPRTAHPCLKFTCASHEPMVIDNLPFDKYELEPSPLTQYILARKQAAICWQVFVQTNGCKSPELGPPFGYLKASTNLTCVNLFVLPYNYPVLLPLLDDLFKLHRCKPTPEWKMAFQQYIDRMPTYYITPMRRALAKMGISPQLLASLVPEPPDTLLSFSVLNYLKRLKTQAKLEFEKLCDVVNKNSANNNLKVADSVRVTQRSPLRKELTTHPSLQDKFAALRDQLNEFGGFVVGLARGRHKAHAHTYRNPFDIQRRELLDQVVRMRANFLQPALAHTRLVDDDSLHSMPVAQMGNYQEYLKRMTPQLREIESAPVRQHMFGNPFKIDKRMMVDEADMDPAAAAAKGAGGGRRGGAEAAPQPARLPAAPPPKRKAGPLPHHVQARRPSSPLSTPAPSPPPPPRRPAPASTPALPAPTPAPALATLDLPVRPPDNLEIMLDEECEPPPPSAQTSPPATLAPHAHSPHPLHPAHPTHPTHPTIPSHSSHLSAATAPPNLPPVIKLLLNGDAYATMGSKRSRSPSPPPPPESPPARVPDTQERQISAILQDIAAAGTHLGRHGKRRRGPESETRLVLSVTATAAPPPPPPPPAAPAPPPRRDLHETRRHNLTVRAHLYRAVRRPGRDFSGLFEQMGQLRGDAECRRGTVREVVAEALRFKRHALARLLEQYAAALDRSAAPAKPGRAPPAPALCALNHHG